MAELLHVTTAETWQAAERAGKFAGPEGGFIHLCTQEQLPFVLERHFRGRAGLLLVRLDPAGLDVRWEMSEPDMAPFPHLYGELPVAAVRRAEPI